ncbi:hypothetical protein BCON_0031g00450 [Botryotinia convoluta]|uniref:Uncharacterized protein n=1 Tax=Botryotinia convoluta TaxID=54673 RepID=A0A4Z1IWL9_9HELO|nr:hypothetical protein BCON_0031g00450 [Botryotinia convoluta]
MCERSPAPNITKEMVAKLSFPPFTSASASSYHLPFRMLERIRAASVSAWASAAAAAAAS